MTTTAEVVLQRGSGTRVSRTLQGHCTEEELDAEPCLMTAAVAAAAAVHSGPAAASSSAVARARNPGRPAADYCSNYH